MDYEITEKTSDKFNENKGTTGKLNDKLNDNKEKRPFTKRRPQRDNQKKIQSIFSRCLITRNILLPITSVSRNIGEIIDKHIQDGYAGKCLVEGYVKPGSIKIVSYSAGTIQKGDKVAFQIVFECEVCFLVEGMLIQCKAVNITKAGIRAETEISPSPVVIFIARDHNYNHPKFSSVQEGDIFTARIIGQRFELNDKYISAIGTLL
jgi:DNA-directed RNA polymerase subunit E'/Rpb7